MTQTYTLKHWSVSGRDRVSRGTVANSSGETTSFVNTGLRIGYGLEVYLHTSGDWVITYPTSFPDNVDQSGYITIAHPAGANFEWKADGKA